MQYELLLLYSMDTMWVTPLRRTLDIKHASCVSKGMRAVKCAAAESSSS